MIPVKKVWTGTGPKNFGMKIVAPSLLRKDWIYENASFDFGLIIELKIKKFKIGKDRVPKLEIQIKSYYLHNIVEKHWLQHQHQKERCVLVQIVRLS